MRARLASKFTFHKNLVILTISSDTFITHTTTTTIIWMETAKKGRERVEGRNESGDMEARKEKGVRPGDEIGNKRVRNKSDSSSQSQRCGCMCRGLVCGCECSLACSDELDIFLSGYPLKVAEQEKARESVAQRPRKLEARQAVILERCVELDGIKRVSMMDLAEHSKIIAGRGSSARRCP